MVAARTLTELDWPRRTARLSLRPAVAGDAQAMYVYRSLPEVSRWMSRQPADPAAFAAFMGGHLDVQLVVELDGEVIGDAMIRVEDAGGQDEVAEHSVRTQAELGWCLAPVAWGQGYATEVATELLVERIAGRAQAEGRADDNPESVRKRLQVYNDSTAPVIGFYENRGTLARIDGVGSMDQITARVLAALQG